MSMAEEDLGWTDATKLDVCLDFIGQMNKHEPSFERYVQAVVNQELKERDLEDNNESDY
jgi:hypothetical protein